MEASQIYMSENQNIGFSPRYLWFLMLFYTMMVVITNWFDARLILIFGIALPPGTIAFPLTLLLSDIITEVYGYKHARRAIWTAFFFNLIFIVYGQAILFFPAPEFMDKIKDLDRLLHTNLRVFIAASVSYAISEPINSYLMSRLKIISNGQYMGFRFLASTVFSGFTDSFLFTIIAFYGLFDFKHILSLIFSIWFMKVLIEFLCIPFSIKTAKWLKKQEKLDVYDLGTNFNPLSLNVDYSAKNNLFK